MPEIRIPGLRNLPLDSDPKIDGRTEFNLSTHESVSDNIRRISGGDINNLVGMEIENVSPLGRPGSNDNKRYQVIDAGILRTEKPQVVTKKVGLPHLFSRGPDGNGKLQILQRSTVETAHKKVGPPKYVKRGRVQGFERDEVSLPPITILTETVTVAEHDSKSGDILGVSQIPIGDFYKKIDDLGKGSAENVKASQILMLEKGERLQLKLPSPARKNDPDKNTREFEAITNALERNGIYAWRGLTWREDSSTKEVVWDGPVKEVAPKGKGYVWIRRFGVKTTLDGNSSVEIMHAVKFAEELAKANSSTTSPIQDMHIFRSKVQPESEDTINTDKLRRKKLSRHLGVNALSSSRRAGVRLLSGRAATKATLWLMSEPEIPQQDASDTMESRADKLRATGSGKRLLKSVKEQIVNKADILNLYDTANEIKKEYLETLLMLDAPTDATDYTITSVMKAIARWTNQGMDINMLFGNEPADVSVRQVLINEMVGRTLARPVTAEAGDETYQKSLVAVARQAVPSGQITEDGQIKHKLIEKLVLNEAGFFDRKDLRPTSKGYAKGDWANTERLRADAREAARNVYESMREGREPRPEDFQGLGRTVRRLASISPAIK